MDRFNRIYALHRILSGHRFPVSGRKLQEELGCSRPTLARIIEEMRDFLGAPIVYDRARHGYHYDIAEGQVQEIPGLWFSPEELHTLLAIQQLLSAIQPGLLENELGLFRQRIQAILQHERLNCADIEQRVVLRPSSTRRPPPDNFRTLAGALLARRRVAVDYHGRDNDNRAERELSPQRLIHYRDNWYLDAWCHRSDEPRRFALDRLLDSRPLPTSAHPMTLDELDAWTGDGYGIFAGPIRHWAELRFTPERARWVADEAWHDRQESSWDPDGHYRLRVPYADPTELVLDILRYGPDVEVMGPPELRAEVARRLEVALARYRSGGDAP
jgi:predicted DNA-binding transcriptional regulator YafY